MGKRGGCQRLGDYLASIRSTYGNGIEIYTNVLLFKIHFVYLCKCSNSYSKKCDDYDDDDADDDNNDDNIENNNKIEYDKNEDAATNDYDDDVDAKDDNDVDFDYDDGEDDDDDAAAYDYDILLLMMSIMVNIFAFPTIYINFKILDIIFFNCVASWSW